MWIEPKKSNMITINCSKCGGDLLNFDNKKTCTKCFICNEYKNLYSCRNFKCDFEFEDCEKCIISKLQKQTIKVQPKLHNEKNTTLYIFIAVIIGLLAISILFFNNFQQLKDSPNVSIVKRLREQFPSQKNETWYHILSVLEQKIPTVKSITLLHRSDKKTSNCLVRKLVNIFDVNVDINKVHFDLGGIQYRDYGEVFEHYHTVVKKFRVLVTNLNIVPSNIARVFHSLCDEVTSDIKPSLFIFTLQYNETDENFKPLEKATGILKQAWSDLPDSDIFPLLCRVVKNVVDIIPENNSFIDFCTEQ